MIVVSGGKFSRVWQEGFKEGIKSHRSQLISIIKVLGTSKLSLEEQYKTLIKVIEQL